MGFAFSRLSKREKYILYLTVIGIMFVFFDKVVIRQVMDKLNKLNEEIFIQEKILQRSLYISSQEDLIVKEHQQYAQNVKQSRSDEEENSEFQSEIVDLAKKSSVFLADIKPGSAKKIGLYKEYTVEIEVESKISYLVDFIYQLEKSPRLLRVKEFRLTPKKKGTATLNARMTITQILITTEEEPDGQAQGRDG